MAKRRRLTPARPDFFSGDPVPAAGAARAPIAQVAGDVAMTAAFEEVQSELQTAHREGRMVLSLPLDSIKVDYLIRDRMACNSEEMDALKESLRARGQQSPVEVTDLGGGGYGLISGWRRLRALKELHEETGGLARFGQVQALLRLPADRSAAYVAMVEENEIRADLSFYERARIVVKAVSEGVYGSDKQALQNLFSTASFSKRSKVKSFMPLVQALDGVLRYPALIPEKLGLALSKGLSEDTGFAKRLTVDLKPGADMPPEVERKVLEAALSPKASPAPKAPNPPKSEPVSLQDAPSDMPDPFMIATGIRISARRGRVELEGDGVNPGLIERLQDWLRSQG